MNYKVKLIDFGLLKIFCKKNKQIIGTRLYCLPEVLDNLYDEKCDKWSYKVLIYI